MRTVFYSIYISSSTLFKLQLKVAAPLNDAIYIVSKLWPCQLYCYRKCYRKYSEKFISSIRVWRGRIAEYKSRNSWNTREYATVRSVNDPLRFECCLSVSECCDRSALQRRSQKAPISLVIISDCDIMSDKSFRSLYTFK